jgi:uncharacterized protein YbdZ (MbtH family)
MIEQAYISGQLGKAIWVDDFGDYFILATDSAEAIRCRWGDIQVLLNSGAEFKDLGRVHLQQIQVALRFEQRAHTALFLFLAGLDEQLSESARSDARRTAATMLEDVRVRRFVRNRLFSRPAPSNLGMKNVTFLERRCLQDLVNQFTYAQPAIRATSGAWDKVAREEFRLGRDAVRVQQFLTDEGFFGYVVDEICSQIAVCSRTVRIGTLVHVFGSDTESQKLAPEIEEILSSFARELQRVEPELIKQLAMGERRLWEDVTYKVVANREDRGAIWPVNLKLHDREYGWEEIGKRGTFAECLAYFRRVSPETREAWKDIEPLFLPEHASRAVTDVTDSERQSKRNQWTRRQD